jgi:hypothetical protein
MVSLGRHGRHHTGRSHDLLAVGEWLTDAGFTEQVDSCLAASRPEHCLADAP